jgi:hypothetical protein
MQHVVLTVSNGGQNLMEVLEYALGPNRGKHPLACLFAFRGAVFLTGCTIKNARVVESESGAEWIAPSNLLASLNRSPA